MKNKQHFKLRKAWAVVTDTDLQPWGTDVVFGSVFPNRDTAVWQFPIFLSRKDAQTFKSERGYLRDMTLCAVPVLITPFPSKQKPRRKPTKKT